MLNPRPDRFRLPSQPRTTALLAWGVALFATGIGLGFFTLTHGTVDLAIVDTVTRNRVPPVTVSAVVIDMVLGPIGAFCILVVLGSVLAILRSPRRALAFVALCSAGWLSSTVAKQIVGRPRPPSDGMLASVTETGLDSFPSGHTALAVSLVWSIALVSSRRSRGRRVAIGLGLVGAVLVGMSRVYLGVHHPTDILGSFLIAAAGVLITAAILKVTVLRRENDNGERQVSPTI